MTASGGKWRLPVTNLMLAPKGQQGATATYTFRFRWARDFAGVRDALLAEGKFDTDGRARAWSSQPICRRMFALRTKNAVTVNRA